MRHPPRLPPGRIARRAIALAIATGLLLGAAPAPGGALRWPLSIDGALLSTFGEYRYDHLHAGIDISTRGATGHRVLAAAAGEIYRLKVEWRGYGRALYLRHPGGRITVYGHLERFEDQVLRLERRVARRRIEAGTRYPGDLYLDPPLRVRRGQLLGFSGESGVGLPHLHFEVRRGEDAPADPFQAGLPHPPDRRGPVLEEVMVTAASPDTFIDGVLRETSYPLARTGAWHAAAAPVRVSGPFLASLVAHDPAGPTGGRAGLSSVRLLVDGAVRYALALRSFRFDQYPQAGLIFDHRRSRLGPARYAYRLAVLPGNTLATGAAAAPDALHPGALDLSPGPHLLEIIARDSAGNESRARLCVLSGRPGVPAPAAAGGTVAARLR
ncbi:MAG: murein hydrolase activator EnvC family protein, partial [Candidatus Polarisedimenticolia bacterium]